MGFNSGFKGLNEETLAADNGRWQSSKESSRLRERCEWGSTVTVLF